MKIMIEKYSKIISIGHKNYVGGRIINNAQSLIDIKTFPENFKEVLKNNAGKFVGKQRIKIHINKENFIFDNKIKKFVYKKKDKK